MVLAVILTSIITASFWKYIVGGVITGIIGIIFWYVRENIQDSNDIQDENTDRIFELEKRMNHAENRLELIDKEICGIRDSIEGLSTDLGDQKERLLQQLNRLKEEYSQTKNDIQWIKSFLEDNNE